MVDALPLQDALKRQPHLFGTYPHRGQGLTSPHREMTDIWLRYNAIEPFLASGDFSAFGDEHASVWYPVYEQLPEAEKVIFDVYEAVNGHTLGGVLITKLPAGGKIYPHRDSGWHAGFYDKYFVAIEQYDGAVFGFEQGDIAPQTGEVYQFDNAYTHWVNNDSEGDRVAMIICIRSQV